MVREQPISRRRTLQLVASAGALVGGGTMVTATNRIGSSESYPEPEPVVPDIIGHRGAAGLEPDNTIRAVQRAAEEEADGVEVDVRRTNDGTLIPLHDPVLDRNTTGTGLVSQMDYEHLDPVLVEGEEPIPTFDEMLEAIAKTDLSVYIDIKEGGVTRDVIARLREHGLEDRAVLLAFEERYLPATGETEVPRGLLGSLPRQTLIDTAAEYDYTYALPHYLPSQMGRYTASAWGSGVIPGVWSLFASRTEIRETLNAQPKLVVTNRPDLGVELREEIFEL